MLDGLQVFVLAMLQGLTEFLPVSSSAHLIFVPQLLGWPDQGLAFDVAVHIGTLIALLGFFRRELFFMLRDFSLSIVGKEKLTPNAKLMWAIGFATIPVGIAGILLKETVETTLRSPVVIGITTVFFGLVLLFADRNNQKKPLTEITRDEDAITWKEVLLIGCSQALSLIPGTSRSGITLTAGLMTGLSRVAAARFSFLLAIPVIVLAGGYETFTLLKETTAVDWRGLALGVLISAVSGYLCIHYFLKLLHVIGVVPFVIYRLVLGMLLLWAFS